MSKNNNSKTILIVVAVAVGILLFAGIVGSIGYYYLYKISTTKSPTPLETETTSAEREVPYQNSRYGFSLKHPSSFTSASSQNNDGTTLTANDPTITIRVYGSANALSQSIDEYFNWIRDNLSLDSQNQEKAKEILKDAVPLGVASIPAEERQWTYVNSSSGVLTLIDHVAFLKDDTFYNLQMEMAYSDYDEYAAHLFDNILASYEVK